MKKKQIFVVLLYLNVCLSFGQNSIQDSFNNSELNYIYSYIINDILNSGIIEHKQQYLIYNPFSIDTSVIILYEKNYSRCVEHFENTILRDSILFFQKVNIDELNIRSRIKTSYCTSDPNNFLSKCPIEKALASVSFSSIYNVNGVYFVFSEIASASLLFRNQKLTIIYQLRKIPENSLLVFNSKVQYKHGSFPSFKYIYLDYYN